MLRRFDCKSRVVTARIQILILGMALGCGAVGASEVVPSKPKLSGLRKATICLVSLGLLAEVGFFSALGLNEFQITEASAHSPPFRRTMEFEGRYSKVPIPLAGLTRIHTLDGKLWKIEDVVRDFKAHHEPQEEAILVVVKTEFCSANYRRQCAITTAVLEKQPIASLRKFRIYMAWVIHPDSGVPDKGMTSVEKTRWDDKVIKEYGFRQGPGASISLIDPHTHPVRRLHTDATEQKLDRWALGRSLFGDFDKTLRAFLRGSSLTEDP